MWGLGATLYLSLESHQIIPADHRSHLVPLHLHMTLIYTWLRKWPAHSCTTPGCRWLSHYEGVAADAAAEEARHSVLYSLCFLRVELPAKVPHDWKRNPQPTWEPAHLGAVPPCTPENLLFLLSTRFQTSPALSMNAWLTMTIPTH